MDRECKERQEARGKRLWALAADLDGRLCWKVGATE